METDQVADNVLARLERRLADAGVPFDVVRHEPVYTSQQAAAVRGTSLSSGAKALVCKADDNFCLFVLPADRKLASKQVRQQHGWKSLRFANPEEVERITGLAPGSIPPFGSLFGLRTYCDRLLADERTVNFNAGDHSVSISMSVQDYLAVESPELTTLTEATP
ncbi:MAG: YbaK/EbsC family protein [Pirellulales bacterium]